MKWGVLSFRSFRSAATQGMRRRWRSYTRQRAVPIGLAALVLLASAWLAAPPYAPPLYDGLGLGNEPYRFVNPPRGHKATPPPTKARQVVQVVAGKSEPFDVSTAEMPPQALIAAGGGVLDVSPSTTSVVVTVKPIHPPGPPPDGYVYDGNIYAFTAVTSGGQPVSLRSDAVVRTAFRGTGKPGKPSIALYASKRWRVRPAIATGVSAQYSTTIAPLGDGGLVVPKGAVAQNESSSGVPTLAVVGAACVGVLVCLFGLLRFARRRREGTP